MKSKGVTWKAIFIGLLFIPLNSYWIVRSETEGGIFYSTTSSLFCNVVFTLFVLTLLNEGAKRWLPSGLLARGELLVVYSMVSVASALSGEGGGQQLVRLFGTPFWYATLENEWATTFHHYLPRWLVVDDKRVLEPFFKGAGTDASLLYTKVHFTTWLRPLLLWCAFILLLAFMMTCINVIVRKQWIEDERLTYPVIQLPLGMTGDGNNFLKNQKMWFGFGVGAGITLLNGIHFLFPIVPGIRNINDVSSLFVSRPWNVVRPMVIAFYPCAIGLAYFTPLDLSFSTWFFFLFWKAQLIFGAILGLRSLTAFPSDDAQATGAYLAIGGLALWISRRQICHLLRLAWERPPDRDNRSDLSIGTLTSVPEPMSYRMAILGTVGGFMLLVLFGTQIGMRVWIALSFFSIYFIISIAVTRMRAELGPLVHELWFGNAGQVMTAVFGTRRISPRSLTTMSMLWWLTRSQNSHVMPHQSEAFKLSERTGIDTRRLWVFMLVAAVLGAFITSYVVLDTGYRYAPLRNRGGFAIEAYERLQIWLYNPRSPDVLASAFMGIGFLFAIFLLWMKRRFLWWPFHPLGYAVTQGDWAITYIWFPVFVSWLLKLLILKYGGIRAHRNAMPFFLGLILGDFVMGATWGLIGLVTGMPTYQFKNW
ncbi:MAG: DUF6785 family protein [Gammaproteobacteria bacterium]|nr:hypothetical protein [Planctomycetota bacterium]